CGSGADGLERAWDLGPDGAHGLSEQERDAVRFRVARGITARPGSAPRSWRRWAEEAFPPPQPWRGVPGAAPRRAATGSRPGSAPRSWRRWAEEAFHPPQPWRELLGAALRAAVTGSGAGDDYRYGRPARRSAAVPGAVLPSLRRTPPRVAVVIDTSGSVADAELGSALLEVAAISRAVGGRRDLVSVVPCDAAADRVHRMCR